MPGRTCRGRHARKAHSHARHSHVGSPTAMADGFGTGDQRRPRRRSPEARAARVAEHAAVTDPGVVLAAGARLLESRSRSVADLQGRLLRAGYPAALVEGTIARLTEIGLLDDEAYARGWLETRDRARPRGERVLRQELRLRGVPREVAVAALDERRGAAAERAD